MGGTPREFFEHPELLALFMPIIRADFQKVETYCYRDKVNLITNDITIIVGTKEDITTDDVLAWKKHTSGNCDIKYFDGGHFFINDYSESITDLINLKLSSSCK